MIVDVVAFGVSTGISVVSYLLQTVWLLLLSGRWSSLRVENGLVRLSRLIRAPSLWLRLRPFRLTKCWGLARAQRSRPLTRSFGLEVGRISVVWLGNPLVIEHIFE
jgi:hypothetical protein